MLFTKTWQHVIDGSKTATRRVIKPNYCVWGLGTLDDHYSRIYDCETHRTVYHVGQRVPVMPARGVRGVGKVADFEIATLWQHDVREISEADAVKEGFEDQFAFMRTWVEINDKVAWGKLGCDFHFRDYQFPEYWLKDYSAIWNDYLSNRPRERYMAVVIEWQSESLVVYADAVARARDLLAESGVAG